MTTFPTSLAEITGGWVETFSNVGSNVSNRYARFAAFAANDMKFHTIYSQRLDMSPNEVMSTQTTHASDHSNVSSGSKWKWGGQTLESGDIIRNVIEYDKEQLNRITD